MSLRVLFIDDDPPVLAVYERQVGRHYIITTAVGGVEGLRALKEQGPFAVVVADYRMPTVDGIQVLAAAMDMAPETVRIMLTGFADLQVAMDAVNSGEIFRFLKKPISTEILLDSLQGAVDHYNLARAEKEQADLQKELLEETLNGSIKILADILSMVNPAAFGRATRIVPLVRKIAAKLELDDLYEFERAAMLSLIGFVTIPPETMNKIHLGTELTKVEKRMVKDHPKIAAQLLQEIPRMETTAAMIQAQGDNFLPKTRGSFNLEDRDILGGYIIKVTLEYDLMLNQGISEKVALMRLRKKKYLAAVIDALENLNFDIGGREVKTVPFAKLEIGMIFVTDVFTKDETLLASKGDVINETALTRLRNFRETQGLIEPFKIIYPPSDPEEPNLIGE